MGNDITEVNPQRLTLSRFDISQAAPIDVGMRGIQRDDAYI